MCIFISQVVLFSFLSGNGYLGYRYNGYFWPRVEFRVHQKSIVAFQLFFFFFLLEIYGLFLQAVLTSLLLYYVIIVWPSCG